MAERIQDALFVNGEERIIGPQRATCERCGKPFTAARADQSYCTSRCRSAAWRTKSPGARALDQAQCRVDLEERIEVERAMRAAERAQRQRVDPECRFPQLKPSSGYRAGCRCPRCRAGKYDSPPPTCESPNCTALRLKGYRLCDQHLAEREHAKAEAKRAKRGKRLQLVCEVCGKTHGDYPSVIANQRENIRELWHRACPACRSRIRGQLANHQLDTYWAMRLLRAETCDVCGHPFARTRNLRLDCVVDHDHACCPGSRSCGRCIRGIIHHACNAMLGHVETAVHEIGWDRVTAYLADERGGRF
jgi:hypothetical protein